MSLFSLPSLRRTAPIVQSEAAECGLASLAMVANHHGHDVDLGYMRALFPVSREGMTAADIHELAGVFGLDARGLGIRNVEELAGLKLPAILYWDGMHFVVLESIKGGVYSVLDPAVGRRRFEAADMQRHFSGVALEFERRMEVAKIAAGKRTGLWDVLKQTDGFGSIFAKVALISTVIGLLGLATPILLQVALDFVLPQADIDLLGALSIALIVLLIFEAAGKWLRDIVILRGAIGLQLQLTRSLVGHGFRLPLRYFEQRHPGDIVTRLDSVDQLKSVAAEGLVRSLADAATSFIAVILMFYYSPQMTGIVLATLLVAFAARWFYIARTRRHTLESLVAKGEERARLLDGLKQVPALKVHNAERVYHSKWYDALIATASHDYRAYKAQVDSHFWVHSIVVVGTVATLYLGVVSVIANAMSVGMLYAFFALRSTFFDQMDTLITNLMQLTTLDAHLRRLDDLIHEKPEQAVESPRIHRRIRKEVRLERVSVSFGAGEAPILSGVDLSLDVAEGESIAIAGASGAGKSSLLKVIASLAAPSSGGLLIDGRPVDQFGLAEYRANVGAVFAGDGIIRGTVADNVTLFDVSIPISAVREAIAFVGLEEEIERLPQGLATMLADENGLMSTGQRRRLLAARAICRRPRLLLFDEITANLDAATEEVLLDGLLSLPGAKVFVTHSERVMARVDRLCLVRDGKLIVEERAPARRAG